MIADGGGSKPSPYAFACCHLCSADNGRRKIFPFGFPPLQKLFSKFFKKGLTKRQHLAIILKYEIRRHGQVVRHGSAKPLSPVRIRVAPPKNEAPQMGCFFVLWRCHSPLDRVFLRYAQGNRFGYPARRSGSLLTRRRAWVFSRKARMKGGASRKKHICNADVLFSTKSAFSGINPPTVGEIASR